MSLFKKRESLVENISYMGLMAAINVLFVLLTTLVPYLLFLVVFVLPLTNCIVALYCKKKYFPIYALATVGLCMVVTAWNISDTIFYVIPSIITGFIFGIMIEKNIPAMIIIVLTAMIQVAISYALLPLVKLITQIDLIYSFAVVFKVETSLYLSYIALLFIIFLSITQITFTYIVISDSIRKMGREIVIKPSKYYLIPTLNVTLLTISLIFGFIKGEVTYFFLSFSLLISIYQISEIIIDKNKYIIIALIIYFFLSIFTFASCYSLVIKPMGLALIGVLFMGIGIIGLVNNYLSYKRNKDTI